MNTSYCNSVIISCHGKFIKKLSTTEFLKNKELQKIVSYTP